jgi:hypothetical protein
MLSVFLACDDLYAADRPWGARAFDAELEGYRFLIAGPGKSGE